MSRPSGLSSNLRDSSAILRKTFSLDFEDGSIKCLEIIIIGRPKERYFSISAKIQGSNFGRNTFCFIEPFLSFCRNAIFLQKLTLSAGILVDFLLISLAEIWQKECVSAEIGPFGRNSLFRFFLHFCRKGTFCDGPFRLSAERQEFSFGRPLVSELRTEIQEPKHCEVSNECYEPHDKIE